MGFYISAGHKSSGKTTISIGVSAALTHLGHDVQTFKRGPDYIDPIWLTQASGKLCYNLDFYTMSHEEILAAYGAHPATIQLVEGNKGLFDGLSPDGHDSNAALANLLDLPVVLVIDCVGSTRGIAPLLLGYQQFNSPKTNIVGVILNKVGGPRHESKLRTAVETYTDLPVIGAVHKNPDIAITERHLGLIPSNETDEATNLIQAMRDVMLESIDIDTLLKVNQQNPARIQPAALPAPAFSKLRIGIAQDEAFGFYYGHDLETFCQLGATLVPFSPIHDSALPDNLDGLFLGGGFPETHSAEISANSKLLSTLKHAIENGLPTYAECGGMMVLADSITLAGSSTLADNKDSTAENSYPMAGLIQAQCQMESKPQGRGYVTIISQAEHPWGAPQTTIYAHEFHYSKLHRFKADYDFAYQVSRGDGIQNQQDGLHIHNLLANYTHLKHTEQFPWVSHFLGFCQWIKDGKH